MSLANAASPAASPNAAIDPRRLFAPFAAALGLAIGAFWPGLMREGDTWWHLKAGEWILANHAVPHVDPFSYTFAGQPWVAHEWLSEALMALAFRAGGWPGLALLMGIAFGAVFAILARRLVSAMPDAAAALALMLVAGLLVPSLTARPHLIAMPFVALWADRLLAAREANRTPPLRLAATMALWANLHGGFLFGFALLAPFAAEAVVAARAEDRRMAAFGWAKFGGLAFAAALATPFGINGFLFPLRLMRLESLSRIGEWQAPSFAAPGLLFAALLGVLALALTTTVPLGAIRAALSAALCAMTLAHARHETLLAIVGVMLLAPQLAALAARFGLASTPARPTLWPALAPLVIVIAAARLLHPIERGEDTVSPVAAFAAVPPALRAEPVLNDYNFGGYLIAQGVKPYIDGRTDLYGDAFIERFADLPTAQGALKAEIDKYGVRWTIFKPDRAIVSQLDKQPGWRRLYSDGDAVVHVRD